MKIKSFLLCLLATISIATTSFGADTNTIVGITRVLDGDTIAIGGKKIRLNHIDSPELKQQCKDKQTNLEYDCGIEARDALWSLVAEHTVTCSVDKIDIYKRPLAECFVGSTNINAYMIRTGHAILYRSDKTYQHDQQAAKLEQLGMWASNFENPWEYRKAKKQISKLKREQAKADTKVGTRARKSRSK